MANKRGSVLLCIETSDRICSVGLCIDGEVKAKHEEDIERNHSKLITTLIQKVLEKAEIETKSLNGMVLSAGPGSYTGLRVGSATAKGICYALDIPLISVDTLFAMVKSTTLTADYYCPMIDARRNEVFCAVYDHQYTVKRESGPMILDEHSFSEYTEKGKIVFLGDGAKKWQSMINGAYYAFDLHARPLIETIAYLGFERFRSGHWEDVSNYEPNYTKEVYTTSAK